MTAAEKASSNGTGPKPNVYQRIAAVTTTVGEIERGSRNQYNRAAIGIEDVEEALAPVLASHGLVTAWRYISLDFLPDAARGNEQVWQAHLGVELINADDPEDRVTGEWIDIGSNPMAATSFARKGYYKATFHLAAEGDEGPPAQRGNQQRGSSTPQRRTTRSLPIEGRACPDCSDQLTIVYRDGKGSFIGHKTSRDCRWRPDPEHERELRDAAPADPDPLPKPQAEQQPDDTVANRILASIRDLSREQQHAIFTDERWPRSEGETAAAWIARINSATRLILTAEIGRKKAEDTTPVPEPEAPASAPAPSEDPAAQLLLGNTR